MGGWMKVHGLLSVAAVAGLWLSQVANADLFKQGSQVLQAQKDRKPLVLRVSKDGEQTLFKADALNPAEVVALKNASDDKKEEFLVANLERVETDANAIAAEEGVGRQLSPTPAHYGHYYGGGYYFYYPVVWYYYYPTYIYYTTITYYYTWRYYWGGYTYLVYY